MSLFRKLFGSSNSSSEEEKESQSTNFFPENNISVDERFIYNFKKNGGKFLYCENNEEVKDQFENILEENDWFESEVLCYDPKLYGLWTKINFHTPILPNQNSYYPVAKI